jgi:hypothetical protein
LAPSAKINLAFFDNLTPFLISDTWCNIQRNREEGLLSTMRIHDLTLPVLLESHLQVGGYKLLESELSRLKGMLTLIDSPRPRLWGYEQILSQHEFWTSTAAAAYLGTQVDGFSPAQIDPRRTLIIGEADEDKSNRA